MKASTERKVIRWLHIIISIPIVGYIYGPVATIPQAAFSVKFIFFPVLVLSGLWLWKGYLLKNFLKRKTSKSHIPFVD
jgi:hypothetical protein